MYCVGIDFWEAENEIRGPVWRHGSDPGKRPGWQLGPELAMEVVRNGQIMDVL